MCIRDSSLGGSPKMASMWSYYSYSSLAIVLVVGKTE